MVKIFFNTDYPAGLVNAIDLIHGLQITREYEIVHTATLAATSPEHSVIFLFDYGQKGVDLVIKHHRQVGYRVFAFKYPSKEPFDIYRLGFTLMQLWPKVIKKIKDIASPFLFVYKYESKNFVLVPQK